MKKLIPIFLILILMVGCAKTQEGQISQEDLYINGSKEKVELFVNTEKVNIEYKDRLFILDPSQYDQLKKENNLLLTYDGQVLDNFNPEKIEKYIQLASSYKLLMKDGSQIETFDRPDVDFDPVSDDTSEIVSASKHGDHYHVHLKDGTEYITYDDPTDLNANIELGEYEGEDHDQGLNLIPVVTLDSLKDKQIVEASIHGDHWHLVDSEGNKYLTYEDPSEILDIEITGYEGSY